MWFCLQIAGWAGTTLPVTSCPLPTYWHYLALTYTIQWSWNSTASFAPWWPMLFFWEAWEPPPKLGFMELINQYELMQHLDYFSCAIGGWTNEIVTADLSSACTYDIISLLYVLCSCTCSWIKYTSTTHPMEAQLTVIAKKNFHCMLMWLMWLMWLIWCVEYIRQQQKQLQQQRFEQQLLRQQKLFEGAFGAASDRHGGWTQARNIHLLSAICVQIHSVLSHVVAL